MADTIRIVLTARVFEKISTTFNNDIILFNEKYY